MISGASPGNLPELSFDYVKAAKRSRGPLAALSVSEIETLAVRYRRFLWLKSRYPQYAIAPTEIIDEMWHLHMLHPRSYYDDCMFAFGVILDHQPGFGSAEHELPRLMKTFNRTARLWALEFGEPYSIEGAPMQNVIICADEEEEEEQDEPGVIEEEPNADTEEVAPTRQN